MACLSVWVPSYLLLHSEWLNNLATVRPPPCYICTAIRHGWALCAADEWPDNVCLGPSWTVKYTTGTLTACRHIGTICHLVSSVAWFCWEWSNTTCCCVVTPHVIPPKLKCVKYERILLFIYDIKAFVCSAQLGRATVNKWRWQIHKSITHLHNLKMYKHLCISFSHLDIKNILV